jgi:hypothetical protein
VEAGGVHDELARRRTLRPRLAHGPVSYTEWTGGNDGVELDDHQTDPHEWTNLAGKAGPADLHKELSDLLRNGQKNNLPPRG